jgi:hypothetical protein
VTLPAVDHARVLAETRHWIDNVVIGLELCPFAQTSIEAGGLRIEVSDAPNSGALREALVGELRFFVSGAAEKLDSALLVAPLALPDFLNFNDFLGVADDALWAESLEGEVQIASFHPDYRFEGCAADDIGNYTNRSPYPMLHLLREASVSRAVAAHPDPEGIPERNVERLRALGRDALLKRIRRGDQSA